MSRYTRDYGKASSRYTKGWAPSKNIYSGWVSDCDGPDLQKCDDAHALAGGRSPISSSDDTHVEFQDYGGHVATVPGECDRKTLSVAVVLLCSSCLCMFL